MTQISEAKKGQITKEIKYVSKTEKIAVDLQTSRRS
jgi:thiamine biosynthesis protein ThiC